MATRFSSGNLKFEVGFGPVKTSARDSETPFNLAILGDFTGRSNRGLIEPMAQRKAWHVDCDNLNQVMAKLDARLHLNTTDPSARPVELRFAELDDFHPDKLVKQAAPLAALADQRQRLLNPATAAAAVSELQSLLDQPSITPAQPVAAPSATTESDAETMARLLGGAPAPSPAAKTAPPRVVGIDQLLKQAVGSSAVAGVTPQQTALLSVVELELAARLRTFLHHPEFQALEAGWRGLDLLVRNFGAEENLKLWIVDVSKAELVADLPDATSLPVTGTWKFVQTQAEQQPWALWLGLYTFTDERADIELLGNLATIAAQTGAPFIANACPHYVNCESFGNQPDPVDWRRPLPTDVREPWERLRALPEAAHVALALPRFLLRHPYSSQGESIETFAFEELPNHSEHEAYLWGNPAVLCGYLVAAAFSAEGWEMQSCGGDVGELPICAVDEDGEKRVKPCAEAWLGERACQVIIGQGLIPVLSIKGRDGVHIPALQSLAGSPLRF
jgi:type VI secretion system protein ImpC